MQINRFDGGINSRLAPHLLKASEAVSIRDVNPTSGVLAPFNKPKDLYTTLGKSFVWFKDKWVSSPLDNISFTEYNGTLFRSGPSIEPEYSKDGVNWNSLRVEVPKNPPRLRYVSNDNPNIEQVVLPIELVQIETGTPNAFGFAQSVGYAYVRAGSAQSFLPAGEYEFKCVFKHPNLNIFGELSLTQSIHRRIINVGGLGIFKYDWDVTRVISSHNFHLNRTKLYARKQDPLGKGDYYLVSGQQIHNEVSSEGFPTGATYLTPQDVSNVYTPHGYSNFKSGDTLNYILEWQNAQGEPEIVETTSITLSYDQAVCYGTKIQAKSGYTLVAYRNGYKCKLVLHNGWYYDNDTEEQINISKIHYLYTYYNSKTDVESPPSPEAEVVKLPNRSVFQVSWDIPTAPTMDKVRVYRYGDGLTIPSLVGTFDANTGTATDNLSEPIDGRLLQTMNYIPAPEGIKGIRSIYAMLWGFKGRRLYFTPVGKPFYWSEFNSFEMDEEITGFGPTSNGILVFSKTSTFLVTGKNPQSFAKFLLSNTIGCLFDYSVQSYNNFLVWLGEDGVYTSNGGIIQDLTLPKIVGFSMPYPNASIVWRSFYLLSDANSTLAIDLQTNRIFYTSDKVRYFSVRGQDLHHVDADGRLFETFGSSTPRELLFKSAMYAEGSLTNQKLYDVIYFHSTGDLQVKVFLDNQLAGEADLVQGVTEVKLNANTLRGYALSFEITGTGTLNEIEYKAEGRRNGR